MLDSFLEVAYDQHLKQSESVKLAKVLSVLPEEDLRKLASGEAKLSFAECAPDSEDRTWLGKYKGTPLFDQALALEKAELEAEVAQTAQREQERASDSLYRTRDSIRLQKKMLDLDLVAQQNGGSSAGPDQPMAVIPNGEAQGAGAPGDAGPDAEPQKLSSAAPNFAQAALSLAKKNPKLIGAGLGAAGGAIAGGPEHRLSGALGGAALGHAAGGIGGQMAAGKSLADAAGGYGKGLVDKAKGMLPAKQNPTQYSVMPRPPATAPTAAHAASTLDALDAVRGRALPGAAMLPGKNNVQLMKAAYNFKAALQALGA